LSTALALCRGDKLGPGLAILIPSALLQMVVICIVLGTTPIIDVMAVVFLAFHDVVDGTRGVLAVILCATSVDGVFWYTKHIHYTFVWI
jgi:hypothetical protein